MLPIGIYGQSAVAPLNYKLNNTSSVSDSYVLSIRNTSGAAIKGVAPVRYPDARIVEPKEIQPQNMVEDNSLTRLARSFEGSTTGYDRNYSKTSLDVAGSIIDYRV